MKIWRFFSSLLLIIALIVTGFELFRSGAFAFQSCSNSMYAGFLWFAAGMVIYKLSEKMFFRKNIDIMQTMSHEGAHMLVNGLFLRRKIYEFSAKASETMRYGDNTLGYVSHNSNSVNIFSTLAPYMFPYITFALLLFRMMIKPQCLPVIDVIIGFSMMFYIGCWIKDTRRDQPDLKACGVLRSYLFIFTFHFFNLAIILYSLSGGLREPVNIVYANGHYFSQLWKDILMLF